MHLKLNTIDSHAFETIAYTFLSAAALSLTFYLFYSTPACYAMLITEDKWGEYGTFASFGIAGVLFLILSFKRGVFIQRLIWFIFGLMSICIAGEEISWGQRIFSIATPYTLQQVNLQGEITLHNLAAFDGINQWLHKIVGFLILAGLIFSSMISILTPKVEKKLMQFGLPLIPMRLVPIFLLAPYFFLFHPMVKADEIGELFLGISVMSWAVDFFINYGWSKRPGRLTAVCVMIAHLFLIIIISASLVHIVDVGSNSLIYRLNSMAERDYPSRGMYDQAHSLFLYIYANPEYIMPDTRINHGKMLLKSGKQSEAFSILSEAAEEEIHAHKKTGVQLSSSLRRSGNIFVLLGDKEQADVAFNKAIENDQRQLALVSEPDKQSQLLWSISQTFKDRGDITAAIQNAEEAKERAISPVLRLKLEGWLKVISEPSI